MNTPVPPTPPSSTVLQNVPTGNTSTATIVQSTITQSSLQLGQNVAATVLSRIAPGQFSIQTDLGQLTLQTAADLVLGQSLNVQIQSLGARPLLLLLPPQTSAAGAPQTQAPQVTGDTSTLTQGSVTKATILRSGQARHHRQPPVPARQELLREARLQRRHQVVFPPHQRRPQSAVRTEILR